MSKRYLALSLITIFVLIVAACSPQPAATTAPATDEPAEPTEAATESATEAATEAPRHQTRTGPADRRP